MAGFSRSGGHIVTKAILGNHTAVVGVRYKAIPKTTAKQGASLGQVLRRIRGRSNKPGPMRNTQSHFVFTLLICLCLFSTSLFSSEQSQAGAGTTTLKVSFRTKAGDKFDGRQREFCKRLEFVSERWSSFLPESGIKSRRSHPTYYTTATTSRAISHVQNRMLHQAGLYCGEMQRENYLRN
jgi:hypothetical protein